MISESRIIEPARGAEATSPLVLGAVVWTLDSIEEVVVVVERR